MRSLQLVGMISYLSSFFIQFVFIARCLYLARRRGAVNEAYRAPPVAGLAVWLATVAAVAWLMWAVTLLRLRIARNEQANNPTWPLLTANAIALISTAALAVSMLVIAPRRSWLPSCDSCAHVKSPRLA